MLNCFAVSFYWTNKANSLFTFHIILPSNYFKRNRFRRDPEAVFSLKYSNDLKSMTQGRGYFEMKLVKYEEVPTEISKKIIDKRGM